MAFHANEKMKLKQATSDTSIEIGENNETVVDASLCVPLDAATFTEDVNYISGWRLYGITSGLCLAVSAAQMELSIVSTSLVAITNDLKGFDISSWVFTAFLLSYAGFIMIWAKLSDIFGRKSMLITALLIFIAASGACGASQTLIQLIMFRCLQGLGASGIFSLTAIVIFQMVPPRLYPHYTALVSMCITLALCFGPLLGGAINDHTTWRWVFLINVPLGSIALAAVVFLLPTGFPKQESRNGCAAKSAKREFSFKSLRRVDIVGALLLLGCCLLIATPLQQAAEGSSFESALFLSLIIFSGLFLVGLVLWEWFIGERQFPEPVFPWRFMTHRVIMGVMINVYIAGTLLTVCTIQIPQRFQTVNGDSAFTAGSRLIAFGLFNPTVGAIASLLISKFRLPPIYFVMAGSLLEIAGTVGLSMTPNEKRIHASQYGFQILTGAGVGLVTAPLLLMIPYVVQQRDLAIGTAAITQFRILGGIIGLAAVTTATNRSIKSQLLAILPIPAVEAILQSTDVILTLSPPFQESVREIFGNAFNLQMKVMMGFALAQVPAIALIWTKRPLRITKD